MREHWSRISYKLVVSSFSEDMTTIRTTFAQLLSQDSMKHIDYKTFNSIQVSTLNSTQRQIQGVVILI